MPNIINFSDSVVGYNDNQSASAPILRYFVRYFVR